MSVLALGIFLIGRMLPRLAHIRRLYPRTHRPDRVVMVSH
jgi:hypothetical protein